MSTKVSRLDRMWHGFRWCELGLRQLGFLNKEIPMVALAQHNCAEVTVIPGQDPGATVRSHSHDGEVG
jgi:hypothetical protein